MLSRKRLLLQWYVGDKFRLSRSETFESTSHHNLVAATPKLRYLHMLIVLSLCIRSVS